MQQQFPVESLEVYANQS
jgi:lipase chaperone LimK